jgi:hypothetical protein
MISSFREWQFLQIHQSSPSSKPDQESEQLVKLIKTNGQTRIQRDWEHRTEIEANQEKHRSSNIGERSGLSITRYSPSEKRMADSEVEQDRWMGFWTKSGSIEKRVYLRLRKELAEIVRLWENFEVGNWIELTMIEGLWDWRTDLGLCDWG